MQRVLSVTKTNRLILAAFAFLAVLAFGSGRAHAATLDVSGSCPLGDAIISLNNAADENSCGSSGIYGTNDTVNIPAGTYTLSADLPNIYGVVSINGAGMGQTIINGGASTGDIFKFLGSGFTLSNLSITNYDYAAVNISVNDPIPLSFQNIEIDGQVDSGSSPTTAITIDMPGDGGTISMSNIYIHDYDINTVILADFAGMIAVSHNGGGTLTIAVENITIANIDSDVGDEATYGIVFLNSNGNVNATVTNATVENFQSQGFTAPFVSVVESDDHPVSSNVIVRNATITGLRGFTGVQNNTDGVPSAAFYALGSAYRVGDIASSTIDVQNSLFANNLNDGTSNNCAALDLTPAMGGEGSTTVAINSLGHNMSDDSSCTSFTQPGDKQNVNNIVSTLGSLQDNGGAVPTRALLSGSPAITAGSAVLGITTDARGVARPASCPSVGSYEVEGAVCAATTTNANTNAGNAAAPNTGIGSTSIMLAVIAGILGFASLGYIFATKRV